VLSPISPQSGISSPFEGPSFALELAGIRRRVMQIKAMEEDDFLPLWGAVVLNIQVRSINMVGFADRTIYLRGAN